MINPPPSEPSYFKRSLRFLFDYFLHSDNKRTAWLLFTGSVLSVIALTGLGFALGWWCFPYIYAAFIAKDLPLLLTGIGAILSIAGGMSGFSYLANFFKNKLYADWRSWLTKKIINQYLKGKYLEISQIYKDLDNPDQRIQDDIDIVVESFLDLSLGFIDNFSNLIIYTVLLWMAGGSLSFVLLGANIMVPGYLVLVALLVGGVTSLISYFISNPLKKLTNEETKIKSDLRSGLQQVKNSAEEIAIEHAEKYHQDRLEKGVDELNKKTTERLSVKNGTTSFQVFNSIFQIIVPFVAAGPLYFYNLISLDVFYSVTYYLSMVTRSLNWFIDSIETINKFKTSLSRIEALQQILDNNNEGESTQKIIRRIDPNNKNLVVKLDIKLPGNKGLVIKGLNLEFTPGVHILIQAPSGAGKSSFFKAMAGSGLSGEGVIIIPKSLESLYFLPQKPTIPDDTLRKVLTAYPDANYSYSDEEIIAALKAVNMEALTSKLDEKVDFKSLGEQQRIAFARILLRKPDWVFLDEATSSVDESLEKQLYLCIKRLLPKTTIISIAHRSTVRGHHDNVLFFKINEKKEVFVEEEKIDPALKLASC